MIDAATRAVLNAILRRESLSLLAYVGDAYPWTTTAGGPGLIMLNKLVRQEVNAISSLGRFLVRQKVAPGFIGSYPASFTSFNFVALGFLVPRLLDESQRNIAQIQADLSKIPQGPARLEVERLLGVKKMTLAGLESLASSALAPASV